MFHHNRRTTNNNLYTFSLFPQFHQSALKYYLVSKLRSIEIGDAESSGENIPEQKTVVFLR